MFQWVVSNDFFNVKHIFSFYCFHIFSSILQLTVFVDGVSLIRVDTDKGELLDQVPFLVDKTMFVKEIIEQGNKTVVITAPNGFGKTTNLRILKSFLEIEVDKKGMRKTRLNPQKEPVTDTKNYFMFVKNRNKISEFKSFMGNYFGKFPVIHLSFECFTVINGIEDAVKFYKRAVHSSYKEHEYLTGSERLSLNEKKFVRFWCDDHNYHTMSQRQVVTGVRDLSRLVSRHFNGSRTWVLVDDYDSLVQAAMLETADPRDFIRVLRFTSRLISYVFRNNSKCVNGGVVTGVLPISLFNSNNDMQYQIYPFLGDHQFVDFFGLTVEEFERMFITTGDRINNTLMMEVEANCGGYQTKTGKKIYNLCSVYRILEPEKPNTNDPIVSTISDLSTIINIPLFRKEIEKLIRGEILPFNHVDMFYEEDLLELRSILTKPNSGTTAVFYKLMLSYLVQKGLITFTSTNETTNSFEQMTYVKIPSKYIKDYMNLTLT